MDVKVEKAMATEITRNVRTVSESVAKPQTHGNKYLREFTPWQLEALLRLQRLLSLKASYETSPNHETWLLEAINKSIFATLMDAIQADVGDEAKAIIKHKTAVN